MMIICFRRQRSWHTDDHDNHCGFCCCWSHYTCVGYLCCRCLQAQVQTDYINCSGGGGGCGGSSPSSSSTSKPTTAFKALYINTVFSKLKITTPLLKCLVGHMGHGSHQPSAYSGVDLLSCLLYLMNYKG